MTTNPLHLDVNEQIECAHTLASRFYIDPAILEIEKDFISIIKAEDEYLTLVIILLHILHLFNELIIINFENIS